MKINIIDKDNKQYAVVASEKVIINEVQDALDLMGDCDYQGASKIIINKQHLHNDFFDLKTGIAGEILQKFSTYNKQLAIVGDFSDVESKSLRDFIRESNRVGRIVFVSSIEEGMLKLK